MKTAYAKKTDAPKFDFAEVLDAVLDTSLDAEDASAARTANYPAGAPHN